MAGSRVNLQRRSVSWPAHHNKTPHWLPMAHDRGAQNSADQERRRNGREPVHSCPFAQRFSASALHRMPGKLLFKNSKPSRSSAV
ncbi:hypothetical protein [Azospirillum brasilense]|uniref:hypothetical protein n=1 Tax=Azospirillum brasilense TaxID=192 RepID=UPI0014784305|nr:hypothetical protein [Azospirillum brasilense]